MEVFLMNTMSRPEIAIHKKIVMLDKSNYVKRKQGDYSLSLKLQIVQQIERGQLSTKAAQRSYGIQARSTVTTWLKKYGSFDWENQTPSHMPKSPEQKIMELEAKVKLLEKQKSFLEQQTHITDSKVIIFDMMINLAEKEYQIDIRKNSPPEQSNILESNNNKH